MSTYYANVVVLLERGCLALGHVTFLLDLDPINTSLFISKHVDILILSNQLYRNSYHR